MVLEDSVFPAIGASLAEATHVRIQIDSRSNIKVLISFFWRFVVSKSCGPSYCNPWDHPILRDSHPVKASSQRWWFRFRPTWISMWPDFLARSCPSTKTIRSEFTFSGWERTLALNFLAWLKQLDFTISSQRKLPSCSLQFSIFFNLLLLFDLIFKQQLQDFSILNSNRPCLQGPHASTFHGVVGSLSRMWDAISWVNGE